MTRYKTTEKTFECLRCKTVYAEREMVIETSMNPNTPYSVPRCPKCNWNQDLLTCTDEPSE